jgi:subtilisin family serine protease
MALAVILIAGHAALSQAARIDPDLKRMLEDKSREEIIPVVMVFPAPADMSSLGELEQQLEGATPSKRKKSVIAALKRRARKAQTDAWEIIDDPDLPGVIAYAEMLYVANAIAFAGDRQAILAVAEAGEGDDKSGSDGKGDADEAILFFDQEYALLDAVGPAGAQDGLKSADADTTWNLKYVRVPEVWQQHGLTGAGILIGHLDTGVDLIHPDLKHRLAVNAGEIPDNGLDDDANGLIDDVYGWDFGDGDHDPSDDAPSVAGHGTHTAGTVVGDGSAGICTGAAPGASLVPVKIFTSAGTSSLARIWAGQQYCVERGCRIITMSAGLKGSIPSAYLRNDRLNSEGLRAAGVTVFNSAGNEHNQYDPPIELGMTARIPAPWHGQPVPLSSTGGIITVGATGHRSDEPYANGSQGPAAWDQVDPWHDWPYMPGPGLIKPDVTAPGVGIRSTLPLPLLYSGETWSGTSMSTPLVAGVAALMLQKNPTLSPAGIDSVLEQTALDLGASGKDVVFGSGRIDALAAVEAVPLDQLPDLSAVDFRPDPGGNGVLDPGELPPVAFEVTNAGLVDATGVVGNLTIDPNPYIWVQDGTANFPDVSAGGQATNLDDVFRVAVSPGTPHGHRFHMALRLETAEGFERTFDLVSYLGLPDHRLHDQGDVYLTVTAHGSLGYVSDAQIVGQGMGLIGGPSALFVSSLWGGTDASYVCNNDLTASGADPAEWRPREAPTGHVQVLVQNPVEQVFAMAFTDSGHAQPRGITVSLSSRAWADPDLAEVIRLDYNVTNYSTADVSNYHAGLFVDWDVVDALTNVGGTDAATHSVWIGEPDGEVYGMAAIGDAPVSNVAVIDNIEYVYPLSHVTNAHKIQLLQGALGAEVIDEPTDLSALVSVGPLHIAAGEQVHMSFLVGRGDSVEQFLDNIRAATGGGQVTSVQPDRAPTPLALAQNVPNPFNPMTTIGFVLPQSGEVELGIYDLAGRRVRTLVTGAMTAGAHSIRWDGRNDGGAAAPSGLYVYRLTTEQGTRARKMLLVR